MSEYAFPTNTGTGRPQEGRLANFAGAMKVAAGSVAFLLAAGAASSVIAFAPVANADTNPSVPYGTNPTTPSQGFQVSNHDEVNTTNGFIDSSF